MRYIPLLHDFEPSLLSWEVQHHNISIYIDKKVSF